MSLGPVAISLIVPPTSLLFPQAAGLLIAWRRPRLGITLIVLGFCGLFALSLPVVSETLIFSLEENLPLVPPAGNAPSAIVILSADSSRNAGVPGVGSLTIERERAGAALYRKTGLPILVTGGSIADSNDAIAELMSRSLQSDFQVPTRWIEPVAANTMQSGPLAAAILQREGIQSIYLVTHAWHMKRSILAFAHTGIAVTAAPVKIDSMPNGNLANYFPRANAWLDSYYALHEWIGYFANATIPATWN